MLRSLSVALLFFLPSLGLAQSVQLPKEIAAEPREQIIVAPDKVSPGVVVNWRLAQGLVDDTARIEKLFGPLKGPGKILRASKPGRYRVEAWVAADAQRPLDRAAILSVLSDKTLTDAQKVDASQAMLSGISVCWVVVGDPGPDPKPPEPKPPEPPPPDPVLPIPGMGLRVLIIEETAERTKLPAAQLAVLFDKRVRDYLNAKCPVGPDGKTREYRIWDKDVDASGDDKIWANALKRPRQRTPWIIIANGKTGFEGPLPANVVDTLALLKKYGD